MSQCEGTMSFGGYPLEIALVFNEKGLYSLSALDSCIFVPEVDLDPAERTLFVRNLLLPILNAKPHHETNRVFARGIICHLSITGIVSSALMIPITRKTVFFAMLIVLSVFIVQRYC